LIQNKNNTIEVPAYLLLQQPQRHIVADLFREHATLRGLVVCVMGGNVEKSETGVFDGLIGPKYEASKSNESYIKLKIKLHSDRNR
jgi:hypothetical protein